MTQPEADPARACARGAPVSATCTAGSGDQVVLEHVTPVRAALRRFLRHRLAIVGLVIVSIIVLIAIFAPLLTNWPPNKIDFQTGARQPPSAIHPLGTDVSGPRRLGTAALRRADVGGGRLRGRCAVPRHLARSSGWSPGSTAAPWTR